MRFTVTGEPAAGQRGIECAFELEHAVPKASQVAGARISVQFRPRGVR